MSLNDLYMPHGQHRTKKDARLITAFISVHVDVHFSAMLLWWIEREKKRARKGKRKNACVCVRERKKDR
jgi:hypothetical protein